MKLEYKLNEINSSKLITEAADAGLEEAMRKLSLMYLHGKGVPKSLALSTQWQEQLVDSLLERYRTDKSDEMLREIYAEQNLLANRYFRLQDDRKALQAASYLKDFAEEKVRRNMTGSRHDLAFCICKMGTMFHKLDDYYSARKYYEEAASLYADLMNNEPSDEIRREFSMVYRYLGMLYNSRNNAEETLRNYKRSEELLLDIRDDGYRKATARYLMSLYIWQAEVIAETERKDIALDLYTKASEIAEIIPPEKADFREKDELADLYRSLGNLYGKIGKSKEAKECRRKEIGILELQIEDARESGMRYADLYIRTGWCHRWLGEQEEARRCYHMCLEAYEEDPDLAAVNESHMNAYEALASLESRYGNHELAKEYRMKEIEAARILVGKTDSGKHMDRLAECLEKAAGDDSDLLEEALAVRQKLYITYKNSNYKIRKDNLRVRIDDLYKRKPELKRYRIAICSENKDKAKVTAETLLCEGFIVTDMDEHPGIFEDFVIMETEPDLILLFFDKDVEASYKAWKKWENNNLKYTYSKAKALVVAEHNNILIVKRDSKENDHEFSVRQYSDSDLVRAIRIQLGMDR